MTEESKMNILDVYIETVKHDGQDNEGSSELMGRYDAKYRAILDKNLIEAANVLRLGRSFTF